MSRLLQGDGTYPDKESTSEEAKTSTQAMTEAPETSEYNALEKCLPDRSTMKVDITICFVITLLNSKNISKAMI